MKNKSLQFVVYKNYFKKMLICRYNWSVGKAYQFNSAELETAFNEGLSEHEAYLKIFNVEEDLCSS